MTTKATTVAGPEDLSNTIAAYNGVNRWGPEYAKLMNAHRAIMRLRTALQRCIAPDGEAARLKHEALLES